MALGSLAVNPNSGLKIIPCGMNYFHAHKFRSRAVVEFGSPIEVPEELVQLYRSGERREATRQLLETVYQALVAVTVTSPDYDTLMVCSHLQLFLMGPSLTSSSSFRRLDAYITQRTRSCRYL
jgi:glycerol-3-phosphate O-acyltransferase/dihydroxyacetone phosphate acyltransferase